MESHGIGLEKIMTDVGDDAMIQTIARAGAVEGAIGEGIETGTVTEGTETEGATTAESEVVGRGEMTMMVIEIERMTGVLAQEIVETEGTGAVMMQVTMTIGINTVTVEEIVIDWPYVTFSEEPRHK